MMTGAALLKLADWWHFGGHETCDPDFELPELVSTPLTTSGMGWLDICGSWLLASALPILSLIMAFQCCLDTSSNAGHFFLARPVLITQLRDPKMKSVQLINSSLYKSCLPLVVHRVCR